ncbi:MAG: GNAT family N-acetyltransferase [Erysipelotrichaceae bacterium]|nr:GNAT family N-acetyltransferase [Erysipelotrichaceae bacterium]
MDKLRLRRSARRDSERIEELVNDYYYERVPILDGFEEEEETVCRKVVDKDGNIIAGCTGYIYPWGCMYIDDMWVDEKYRGQGIGSNALQAVEKVAEDKGCHIIWLGTWDFQARPYYLKHGYKVFATINDNPVGHTDYELYKRTDDGQPKRPCKPMEYQLLEGSEEDAEFICDQLDEGFNKNYIDEKHDYIKINRKLVDKDGKVVAAIMAGVTEIDTGWIWKIWVDEKYRHQGLGTRLLKHYEKLAKEKGATKIISEEIYDWNVGFFLKNGYKVAGELPDLPKGHSFFIVEKDL